MANDYRPDQPGYVTVLVAFAVCGANESERHETLMAMMPAPADHDGHEALDCWWVAEDTRYDRSDNDSAIFVPMGKQAEAVALLRTHGLL